MKCPVGLDELMRRNRDLGCVTESAVERMQMGIGNSRVSIRWVVLFWGAMSWQLACSGNPPPVEPEEVPAPAPNQEFRSPPPAPPEPPAPLPTPLELPPEDDFAMLTLEELNRDSPLEPVFFSLDNAELDARARLAAEAAGELLQDYPTWMVTIEGHCDERGTNEYNLALGDSRAAAVRDYLVSLGIPGNRVSTVSRGEESPFCSDSHEGCWSRNRRGHFVVTAK